MLVKTTRFRKKPIVIEAFQFTQQVVDDVLAGRITLHDDLQVYAGRDGNVNDPRVAVHTLEGGMIAGLGDWIITGVSGEHYPCKDDIFRRTYDPV